MDFIKIPFYNNSVCQYIKIIGSDVFLWFECSIELINYAFEFDKEKIESIIKNIPRNVPDEFKDTEYIKYRGSILDISVCNYINDPKMSDKEKINNVDKFYEYIINNLGDYII